MLYEGQKSVLTLPIRTHIILIFYFSWCWHLKVVLSCIPVLSYQNSFLKPQTIEDRCQLVVEILRHELLDGRSTPQARVSKKWHLWVWENNVQHRQRDTGFLRENSNQEKPRGGGKFTMILEFTRTVRLDGISWVWIEWKGQSPFLLEERVYLYWTVDGEGEPTRFLHDLHVRVCYNGTDYERCIVGTTCREYLHGP